MMPPSTLTDARKRVLEALKRAGPLTAGRLADELGMTDVAARQHLAVLETLELVEAATQPPQGRGRPAIAWSLTDQAMGAFPDHHAELTVGLIEATRKAVGEEGLHRIIEVRARDQVRQYKEHLPSSKASLKKRVEALAAQRTEEGYMAEVRQERPGVYLLIEHHCPICDAARTCTKLCSAELSVFQRVLGKDVQIERTQHLLSDDARCVYRIQSAA